MAIRVSGLISGLDTDSIVQELVSAYSTKKEKYEKAQTKQEWKMDAWKTMNSKIYGFYNTNGYTKKRIKQPTIQFTKRQIRSFLGNTILS